MCYDVCFLIKQNIKIMPNTRSMGALQGVADPSADASDVVTLPAEEIAKLVAEAETASYVA